MHCERQVNSNNERRENNVRSSFQKEESNAEIVVEPSVIESIATHSEEKQADSTATLLPIFQTEVCIITFS